MKLFTAGMIALYGANAIVINEDKTILKTIEHKSSLDINVDAFHIDTDEKNFVDEGNKTTIYGKQPIKFMLNPEQTDLMNDTNVRDLKIALTYEAEFITDKVKTSVVLKQEFNDQFMLVGDPTKSTITNLKGEEINFTLGCKYNKIVHQDTKYITSVQLLPVLKFNKSDFESGKGNGFYSLKVTNVLITGHSDVYDLSSIKRKTFVYKFEKGESINPEKIIKGEKFENFFWVAYRLPYEYVDQERTFAGLNFDKFNPDVDNEFKFKIVLKDKYKSIGELIQRASFQVWNPQPVEEPKEEAKQPEPKPAEKEKINNYENGNQSNPVEKKTKKVNALKYLWLLTIPVLSIIGTLITYFVPFRKRKSKNDIK